MAVSLRKMCSALGLTGRVSICQDLLGFTESKMPAAVVATRPKPTLNLNRFAQLLKGQHFHVRLIVAGSDLLSANDGAVIDYAVFRLRDIYSAAGIGVGRVTWDMRAAASSAGHATVNTSDDLDQTGHDLTADGDFVPVVIPANMNVSTINPDGSVFVVYGRSPTPPGPCSPRTGAGMRSSVIDIVGEETGRTLAHEVGHYLGAKHPSPADNSLMTQTGSVTSGNAFSAVSINAADKTTMLGHCTIRPGLPGI